MGKMVKRIIPFIIVALFVVFFLAEGNPPGQSYKTLYEFHQATNLENSLFKNIVNAWYPRCLDTLYGGYTPNFEYDWNISPGPQNKFLVQQARHLWTLSFLYENYPDSGRFLDYAAHGFRFIRDHLRDTLFGGFYYECNRDGSPRQQSISFKRIYGEAFAIKGLALYYKVSGDPQALALAKSTFRWMDDNARDRQYGGYFQVLKRDGTPVEHGKDKDGGDGDGPLTGLKEFNSSLHLLEAFTELYSVWPDETLRSRFNEMYLLFRDTFIDPKGYLRLYFYPDWTLVPAPVMDSLSEGNYWYTQHITYGHDVETAYLLEEAGEALGIKSDDKAKLLGKKLVDHALAHGWDNEKGGFYYVGYEYGDSTRIHVPYKAWWVEAEGLNALLMMSRLYPDDPAHYYDKFVQLWLYTDKYLIDHQYGGWYNWGLDNNPGNRTDKKSHNWKATYHNVRAMENCVMMQRGGKR
ncbi:MAG TPA: AGE family epimerase/isomerase [Bacteroidales bacterium]|nr:AGE family epimerase/isomerase [Bacteroidales bacterium]